MFIPHGLMFTAYELMFTTREHRILRHKNKNVSLNNQLSKTNQIILVR